MCGVIGVFVKQNDFPHEKFSRLLRESQIRGQHATGIAWVDQDDHPLSQNQMLCSLGACEFVNSQYPSDLNKKVKAIVGHTRYSTSNLAYNQPIVLEDTALVLNGVVTQSDPSEWKQKFGVDCLGKNDAEILLRCSPHPLLIEPSSQACVVINSTRKEMRFWRNEERPLYFLETEDSWIVASTKDIFHRAGFEQAPKKCEPCVEYCVRDGIFQTTLIRQPHEDLQ